MPTARARPAPGSASAACKAANAPHLGQVVLVMQGGGALGAYHWGVYEALQAAGVEPDWVIGTSIGAINAALIAGNAPADRAQRLAEFWRRVQQAPSLASAWTQPLVQSLAPPWRWADPALERYAANLAALAVGIPNFFEPNPALLTGVQAPVGVERAAYYRTEPLRRTLAALLDERLLGSGTPRVTVGAVHVTSGQMRYFDSGNHHSDSDHDSDRLTLDHVMASGALPPAFGAVRVGGEPYWDGGIYSNTPIEAVFDARPRRSSLIFNVDVWHAGGPEPESIWQVLNRQKEIQYASRAENNLSQQKQIHALRHVVRELVQHLPAARRTRAEVQALAAHGCATTMHVAHLLAPRQPNEDANKDIDFSAAGIAARRTAGRADAEHMLERAPWSAVPDDPTAGIVEHR